MCRKVTTRFLAATSVLMSVGFVFAQTPVLDWRHIGNAAVELSLPSVATGPVDRVWYSDDGFVLYARTATGRIFETNDFEQWRRSTDAKILPPSAQNPPVSSAPEPGLRLASQGVVSGRLYGVGRHAYRSDDGGLSWSNLTGYKGVSILGEWLSDVAASPRDPDEVVVASLNGVWRSMDGGLSWSGINQFLPNLPAGRLLSVPSGARGVRLSLAGGMAEIEWAPGEKSAWKPVDSSDVRRERDMKSALSQVLKHSITAINAAKDYIYAGDSEGRLIVSPDAGASWPQEFKLKDKQADLGLVQSIWVDSNDPRVAVAVLGARPVNPQNTGKPTYVLRTMNGGVFWDDITVNLPDNAVAHGVTADRGTGAVYAATDTGVYFTMTDLAAAGRPTSWTSLSEGLPSAPATDVKLDAGGNQLYVDLDGYGVYATIAPHRLRDARVVSAADYSSRPASPGALLSVLGARVESARSANTVVPVLAATDTASQIQVPFEAKGNTVSLAFEATAGRFVVGLPLLNVSPAIFVDPEGTPLIMDADSGVLLDATKPAHSNTRIQVLATGFGRVKPDWPTGLAAPLADPPRVAAQVHAYLDRIPLEVSKSELAGGYVGFYLIEIQLPRVLNTGPAELYLEAEGQQSNRVRLYIEP
jgi:uncharacterized protein (TIGR03437 family)